MLQNNFTWVCSQSLPITMWEIVEWKYQDETTFGVEPIQVYDVHGTRIRFTDSRGDDCNGYPNDYFRSREDAEAEIMKRVMEKESD